MNKEICKGWKVIRKIDRKSCTAKIRYYPVIYKKNKKIKSPVGCGPLAVFKTREAARSFLRANSIHATIVGGWKIVKCVYIQSLEKYLWEHDRRQTYPKLMRPKGTDFADSVTCLE